LFNPTRIDLSFRRQSRRLRVDDHFKTVARQPGVAKTSGAFRRVMVKMVQRFFPSVGPK